MSGMRVGYRSELSYRFRPASEGQPTLLFIHGLGESGLCFEAAFRHPSLSGMGLLVPDLPGYGRSGHRALARTFSLEEHASFLSGELAPLLVDREVVVVGHSMGGVIGTHLLKRGFASARITGFANVEGNLTLGDCSFSSQIAPQTSEKFEEFGHSSLCDALLAGAHAEPAWNGYQVSLRFADPGVVHRCSVDLVQGSKSGRHARHYARLPGMKRYFLGERSSGPASRRWLARHHLAETAYPLSGHWPFLDEPEAFWRDLSRFARVECRGGESFVPPKESLPVGESPP